MGVEGLIGNYRCHQTVRQADVFLTKSLKMLLYYYVLF